ncbi:MAG: hypothetical protein KatS3mg003_0043 [Candidatus Nitrosocaldaceae archaeon]|nr:MAG: hypothetical protein KatS3mg003_0043 [Candidatus Nitrosocaldaceae archaeon]
MVVGMKVLAIGAHPDDVELGVGGTLAKHSKLGDEVHIVVCTLGGIDNTPSRINEARKGADILNAKLHILDFNALSLNKYNKEFVKLLRDIYYKIEPDRLYVHSNYDLHQVHVTVNKCALKACNDIKQIIFYESLSSTTKEFKPDAYVDITEEIDIKIKAIKAHKSQANRTYMHPMPIRSLANYRYVQGKVGNDPKGYAEAFMIYRLIF